MESFFFNITDRRYKTTKLFKEGDEHITRVDISNGIVFFDMNINRDKKFFIKNLDRMVVISLLREGAFEIFDNRAKKRFVTKKNRIDIFCSSRQDFELTIKSANAFILFIADFFLKRYLLSNKNEPIDFLYEKIQNEISLKRINTQPIDALSLYIIDKIIDTKSNRSLQSIRCEHSVIEFMIHRFSLIDMIDEKIDKEELEIAKKAKANLLKSFSSPPTIKKLSRLCATNESKLKKIFKKVYKSTIYGYIQKLRLEEANLLLRERELNIGEIAKKVGYRHQGHFSKLFFKTYGVYPKDLLKK